MRTTVSGPLLEKCERALRHMLGASPRTKPDNYGFRNYYCAQIGFSDHALMKRMEELSLVRAGRKINDGRDQIFHATRAGCRLIDLDEAAMKRAGVQ